MRLHSRRKERSSHKGRSSNKRQLNLRRNRLPARLRRRSRRLPINLRLRRSQRRHRRFSSAEKALGTADIWLCFFLCLKRKKSPSFSPFFLFDNSFNLHHMRFCAFRASCCLIVSILVCTAAFAQQHME